MWIIKTIFKDQIKNWWWGFFLVSKKRNESETISKEVNGTILDINDNQLIILDKKEIKTYFINKNEAFLKGKPAFFLYNMYGECMCRNE